MCAADSLQQKSRNLCLTVKFTLGNPYFLFRLKGRMHIRYLYDALSYTFQLQHFHFIQSYSSKCINHRLGCLKHGFLCRSLLDKRIIAFWVPKCWGPAYTTNSYIIRYLLHIVNACKRKAFFCQQYYPTSPSNKPNTQWHKSVCTRDSASIAVAAKDSVIFLVYLKLTGLWSNNLR